MITSTSHRIVPILCFHHIADLHYYTAISQTRFIELLVQLQEAFTLVDASDLSEMAGRAFARPPLLLSFDDAYEDNVEPLLAAAASLACKGIIFPVANYVGKQNDWNGKAPYRARHASRSQLAELLKAGYQIGSHTLDHINLVRLTHAEIRTQTRDSRKRLEDMLQAKIAAISYPFGWFNQEVLEIAAEDYRLGFSTLTKGGAPRWRNQPYAIGRLSVGAAAGTDQILIALENWLALNNNEMDEYVC